jgi:large subunit ribosomal protein L22
MEIRASAKSVRISPRKVRLVADAISKLSVTQALHVLTTTQKRAGTPIRKTLQSAVANAVNNKQLEEKSLKIHSIQVTDGPVFKRFRPSTRGRIHPYKKRSSHITITLVQKGGQDGAKS